MKNGKTMFTLGLTIFVSYFLIFLGACSEKIDNVNNIENELVSETTNPTKQNSEGGSETTEIELESYNQYIQEIGDIHFSFLYPNYYGEFIQDVLSDYVGVWVTDNTKKPDIKGFGFYIETFKPSQGYFTSAEAQYQNDLARIEGSTDTEILENGLFNNGNFQGNLIEYSYYYQLSYIKPISDDQKGIPVVEKSVYFEVDEYIWHISLMAPKDIYTSEIKTFDVILDSLIILD